MMFREFCPTHMKNIIKEKPKQKSIPNDPLNIMFAITQSINKHVQGTYPYLSLAESLSRMVNTRQQKKSYWWSNRGGLNRRRAS